MKKVAVIIPTFNEAKSLHLTLENLRKQTFRDFELIVKDGVSTDRTVDTAAKFGAKVISTKDVSAGDARNQATEYVDKDCAVLVFVDADTTLASDALERIIEDFEKYRISLIIPKYVPREETMHIDDRIVQLPHPAIKLWFWFEHFFRKYVDKYSGGMCMPVDAQIFKSVGGFREDLIVCEDIEISYRLRKAGRVLVDDKILVYVSTRRYLREGIPRGLLTYLAYRAMWHLGIHQPMRASAR